MATTESDTYVHTRSRHYALPVWVHGGGGHADRDLAPLLQRRVDELLQLVLVGDVAGHGHRLAAVLRPLLVDLGRDGVAHVRLAARYDDLGARLGHARCDGLADALGRTGHDRDLPAPIQETHLPSPSFAVPIMAPPHKP